MNYDKQIAELMRDYGEHKDIFHDRLLAVIVALRRLHFDEVASHFRGLDPSGSHEMTIDDVTDEIVALKSRE